MEYTDQHIISHEATVTDALRQLNQLSGRVMTLFVTDGDGRLAGTLTDGDIRRGLLAGATLNDKVTAVAHRNFRALRSYAPDLDLLRQWRTAGIRLIPELDADGRITDIIDTSTTTTRLPVSAILMAGGKGERLRPMTLTVPKPLLEIDGKAIIDYNVEAIERAGIKRVRVAVNYLADAIRSHFANRPSPAEIECVGEPAPLGTLGAASLMDHEPEGDTLVMNADILTTLSLEDFYLHHRREHNAITIAAIPYNVAVP